MNKSELIDAISGSSGVGKGDIDSVLKALEEVVTSAVCGGGDKISLSGFLTFERTYRAARTGRNPQTGEALQIAGTNAIKVSAGSKLKAAAKASTSAY
jgi:DNA-binding protein HU-beta